MKYGNSTLAGCLMAACLCASPLLAAAPLLITTEQSPPSSMRGPDGVIGRDTDKVREMMARSGIEYRIDILPWKRAYTTALSNPNSCVYATSRTPEREHLFKWVGPTDEADWILFGRADRPLTLKTLEDARGLRIGTYNGDARDEYLRSRGFTVDPVTVDLVNPHKLLLGRIDLWAVALRYGTQLGQYEWGNKIVPLLVFNRVKVYLACNPALPDELIERLNAAMNEVRRDGTAARIERKYEHWTDTK